MGIQEREYMGRRPPHRDPRRQPGGKNIGVGILIAVVLFVICFRLIPEHGPETPDLPPFTINVPKEIPVPPPVEEIFPIDLNTATLGEIDRIPGLASPVALSIFNRRPYAEAADLLAVPGIAERRLALIKPYITLSPIPREAPADSEDKN